MAFERAPGWPPRSDRRLIWFWVRTGTVEWPQGWPFALCGVRFSSYCCHWRTIEMVAPLRIYRSRPIKQYGIVTLARVGTPGVLRSPSVIIDKLRSAPTRRSHSPQLMNTRGTCDRVGFYSPNRLPIAVRSELYAIVQTFDKPPSYEIRTFVEYVFCAAA